MQVLEKEIEKAVCEYAKGRGVLVIKMNAPSDRGWPDRMFIYCTHVMWIEFKRPGKKLRKLQKLRVGQLEDHGMHVLTIDNTEDGVHAIDAFLGSARVSG